MKTYPISFAVLTIALLLLTLPLVACEVTFGGTDGNVTLINPGNSTIFYDAANSTTYQHITNYPDGWWVIPDNGLVGDDTLWVIGMLFGIIAIALALTFALMRRDDD